jgi:hypothetical protein
LQGLSPKPDEVFASDFRGGTMLDDVGDPTKLGRDKARLDRMLAHLSYNRTGYTRVTARLSGTSAK